MPISTKRYSSGVSTVQEIQVAIQSLPEPDRFELIHWLQSTYQSLSPEEEAELVADAAQGLQEIREGKGIPLQELYQQTRLWTSK